jgi:hypothetical protein
VLQLEIPERELFDESTSSFLTIKKESLQLEHSLVSLSKWEANWRKPFLGKETKTTEETIDYIKCMTVTQNIKNEVYDHLPGEVFSKVDQYIQAPMSATWFSDNTNTQPQQNREVITAEIIYYWMITLNIPMECQKWHLNRLLTLIKVCNLKNQPAKKQSRHDMLSQRAAANAARKAQYNTPG